MLVLGRKQMEALFIGTGIRVTVLKVDRNHVKLGIEAPGDVSVFREELLAGRPDQGDGGAAAGRLAPSDAPRG